MDKRVKVREWAAASHRNFPPQLLLDLDAADLSSIGDTVTTVLIKKNGKVARVNLRIAESGGRVKATVSADSPNRTSEKTVIATFGWVVHPDDPYAVEFPPDDERRTSGH